MKTMLASTLTVALAAFSFTAAAQYNLTDLGTLGGPSSAGFSINNFGRITGIAWGADYAANGFLWNAGMTAIPPLAGDLQCHGFDINNAALVVATSYDLGELTPHGLAWQNGTVTSLGNFAPRGVSDANEIVGFLSINDVSYGWVDHAARWSDGVLFDLGTMGGHFSYAADVSTDGRIVGRSMLSGDTSMHAFLWLGGVFHDLGTLGGVNSQAYAINDAGDVVGCSTTAAGADRAFLYTTDAGGNVLTRTDLGHLGNGTSYAHGLNMSRQVVGTSSNKAFVWDGTMHDLNTMIAPNPDWKLESAWSINSGGQIVGMGTYRGFPHAFLLTPSTACPGDLNGDRVVDLSDLGIVLSAYGLNANGDLDGDGDTDLSDLGIVLSAYGSTCP